MDITPTEIEYEGRRYRLVEDSDILPILGCHSKPYTYTPPPPIHTVTPVPGPPVIAFDKLNTTTNADGLNFIGQIAL